MNVLSDKLAINKHLISCKFLSVERTKFCIDHKLSKLSIEREGEEIGVAGAVAMAEALSTYNCLTILDFGSNCIGDIGAQALAAALMSGSCALATLNINSIDNNIGDDGATAIANALTTSFCFLTSLNLSNNNIGDYGGKALLRALPSNRPTSNTSTSNSTTSNISTINRSTSACCSALLNLSIDNNKLSARLSTLIKKAINSKIDVPNEQANLIQNEHDATPPDCQHNAFENFSRLIRAPTQKLKLACSFNCRSTTFDTNEICNLLLTKLGYANIDTFSCIARKNHVELYLCFISLSSKFQLILEVVLNYYSINASSVSFPKDMNSTNYYNPRELCMCIQAPPFTAQKLPNRTSIMTMISHELIWKLDCTIYGGFIRDFIINNQQPNDIDVMLTSNTTIDDVFALYYSLQSQFPVFTGIKEINVGKGIVRTLEINGNWEGGSIQLDIKTSATATNTTAVPAPGVECSASNLKLSKNGIQLLKSVPNFSLELCKHHCAAKIFYWYYDFNKNSKMCLTRIQKYFKKQWVCLSTIPQPFASELAVKYPGLLHGNLL